jgi:hypothetical protein
MNGEMWGKEIRVARVIWKVLYRVKGGNVLRFGSEN